MHRVFLPALVIILSLLALSGCRKSVPVQDLSGQPFPAVSAKFNDSKVKDAIVRAGEDLGWQIAPSGPQQLTGTLRLRTHTAVVVINYSLPDKTYSISYVNSANLDYEDGLIHPNYNNWVHNLDKAIGIELSKVQ